MAALRAIADVAKFKPREKEKEFKVWLPVSLVKDLNQIIRVRNAVNAATGDGTEWSITQLLEEGVRDLRDSQLKEWGGAPKDEEKAEKALIERLIAVFRSPDPESK